MKSQLPQETHVDLAGRDLNLGQCGKAMLQ